MEEKGVSRENHRAAAYIGKRLSNNVVSIASSHEWESNSQLYWSQAMVSSGKVEFISRLHDEVYRY